jgi:acyl carrier protein
VELALNSSVLDGVVVAIEQITYTEEFGITSATRLADDLHLGRFGRAKLALSLEEVFEIELPDEALKRFSTVGDIVEYLNRYYLYDLEFPICAAPYLVPQQQTGELGAGELAPLVGPNSYGACGVK